MRTLLFSVVAAVVLAFMGATASPAKASWLSDQLRWRYGPGYYGSYYSSPGYSYYYDPGYGYYGSSPGTTYYEPSYSYYTTPDYAVVPQYDYYGDSYYVVPSYSYGYRPPVYYAPRVLGRSYRWR